MPASEQEQQAIIEMANDQFERIKNDPYDGGHHVAVLVRILDSLPADIRAPLMRGKKTIVAKALTGTPSRASAHYLTRALAKGVALQEAGLVDVDKGWRDVQTGRKVKSIIGELARLAFANDQAFTELYLVVRDWPLGEVKAMVRKNRGNTFVPDSDI